MREIVNRDYSKCTVGTAEESYKKIWDLLYKKGVFISSTGENKMWGRNPYLRIRESFFLVPQKNEPLIFYLCCATHRQLPSHLAVYVGSTPQHKKKIFNDFFQGKISIDNLLQDRVKISGKAILLCDMIRKIVDKQSSFCF